MTAKEFRHMLFLVKSNGYCSAKYKCNECLIMFRFKKGAGNCNTNVALREAKKFLNKLTEEDKLEILIGEFNESF